MVRFWEAGVPPPPPPAEETVDIVEVKVNSSFDIYFQLQCNNIETKQVHHRLEMARKQFPGVSAQ